MPDDGCDELKHVVLLYVSLKCRVWLHTSFAFQYILEQRDESGWKLKKKLIFCTVKNRYEYKGRAKRCFLGRSEIVRRPVSVPCGLGAAGLMAKSGRWGMCGCSAVTNISFGQWAFYSLIILSIHNLIYCATTRYTWEGPVKRQLLAGRSTCWTIPFKSSC